MQTHDLTDLDLDEVSLVDDGMNQHAKAVLVKRHIVALSGKKGDNKGAKAPATTQDRTVMKKSDLTEAEQKRFRDMLDKGMTEEKAMSQIETERAEMEKMRGQVEALTKALTDAGYEVELSKDGTPKVEKRAEPEVDERGNLLVRFGSGDEHVAFVAHLDEVGTLAGHRGGQDGAPPRDRRHRRRRDAEGGDRDPREGERRLERDAPRALASAPRNPSCGHSSQRPSRGSPSASCGSRRSERRVP